MARDGIGCCGGLDPHGRGVLHEAPEGTTPKLAERVLTQPHAAEGKEKGKSPAGVNTSIGEPDIRKSAPLVVLGVLNETLRPGQELRPPTVPGAIGPGRSATFEANPTKGMPVGRLAFMSRISPKAGRCYR